MTWYLQDDINREAGKISVLSSGKIDKYEFLTGKEILPLDQRRVMEQTKFNYSPLERAFEKQIKTIEDQGEKPMKTLKEHGKKLVESNELFNIDRDSLPFDEQRKIFNRLVKEKPYECNNAKEKIYPINLAYEFKTEGTIPKHFSNHQNQIDLFKNLRDGNINPTEALKTQIVFKSDLGEIKKRKSKIKIKRLNKCNTKCSKFFWFKRNNYYFF